MGKIRNSRELVERYGVEKGRYHRPGQNYLNEETPDEFGRRVAEAANKDYDTREQQRAFDLALRDKEFRAGLDKETREFVDNYNKGKDHDKGMSGIRTIKDVYAVHDFGKLWHKHESGRGGKFTSVSDFGGATQHMDDRMSKFYDRNFLTKGDQLQQEPDVKTPKSLLPDNYTPSEETAAAQDFVSQYEESIRNSPDGLLDPGSMGESQTLKGTSFNAEDASEQNDKAQGFFQDQLLNLTEGFKKYNINTVGPNSIASKNRDLLRTFPTT